MISYLSQILFTIQEVFLIFIHFLNLITPLCTLIALIYVINTYKNSVDSVSPAVRISNNKENFVNIYPDRKFPEIHISDAVDGYPTSIGEVKDLRSFIKKKISSDENISKYDMLIIFRNNSCNIDRYENKLAYILCIGMQQAGLSVISGTVPFWSVLISHGEAVVEDWVFCSSHVEKLRAENSDYSKYHINKGFFSKFRKYPKVKVEPAFRRRHAEWLAIISILYVWERSGFIEYIEMYNKLHFSSLDKIQFKEYLIAQAEKIMDSDKRVVDRSVRKNFKILVQDIRRKP